MGIKSQGGPMKLRLTAQKDTKLKLASEKTIAQLNDMFRQSFQGGQVVLTRGVSNLPEDIYTKVIQAVRDFNKFTNHNDPYGEHDMGMFKVEDLSFMWKIDYYDVSMQYASPDPADPSVTKRVLTIMLSSEY